MSESKADKAETVDRRELRTTASPHEVWRAWADPEIIAQWFADRAEGEAVPGKTIAHIFEAFGMKLEYRVIEAQPGERLVLEGTSPQGLRFRQEVLIRRDGGETVMELVHSGFDDDADWGDEYEGIDSGWKLAFAILKHYLEQHFGRARVSYFAMQPAELGWGDLERFFRQPEGLATWLTRSGAIPEVGESYELILRDGQTVSGKVLAWSGREAALTWEQADGVIELKAFAMGPAGRAVALRSASWASEPPPRKDTEVWMSAALSRLVAALVK